MNKITIQDLSKKISKLEQGELILDVRMPEEYAQGHMPGSVGIPLDQLSGSLDKLRQYKKIYIYCHSGRRASAAFDTLKNAGLNNLVCISDGGMATWLQAGYPVEH